MSNKTGVLLETGLIYTAAWSFWLICYASWLNGNAATDALRAIPSGV